MKNKNLFLGLIAFPVALFFIAGCNDEPAPINEEEVITTFTLTFIRQGGGDTAIFQYRDADGIGGNLPVITNDILDDSATYSVALTLLNEAADPDKNITQEIFDEGEAHQFFFQPQAGLNLTFDYNDSDAGGHPIGLSSTATTGAASNGMLTVTLRHEPDKHAAGVEDGDITNAGGETDLEVTFDVAIP